MSVPFRLGMALILLASLSAGSLWAASLPVYTGTADTTALNSWGAGTVEVDKEVKYADNPSLRVKTKNYFEGAYLKLAQPAELAPYVANKDNGLVVLVVQIPQPSAPVTPGMPPGMPPMPPGTMAPGMPPPPMPPAMPPTAPGMPPAPPPPPPPPMPGGAPPPPYPDPGMPMDPTMYGMPGMPGTATPLPPEKLDQLRIVLITDRGQIDTGALDTGAAVSNNPDWLRMIVPLSQCAAPADLAGAKLLGVMLAGNTEGEFNVGQLYLKVENPPLVAKIEGERVRVVREKQQVELKAAAQPGGGRADYSWDIDFDNGLGTDALGPTATVEYPKEGRYVVSLQVADPDGQREARLDQILIVVQK